MRKIYFIKKIHFALTIGILLASSTIDSSAQDQKASGQQRGEPSGMFVQFNPWFAEIKEPLPPEESEPGVIVRSFEKLSSYRGYTGTVTINQSGFSAGTETFSAPETKSFLKVIFDLSIESVPVVYWKEDIELLGAGGTPATPLLLMHHINSSLSGVGFEGVTLQSHRQHRLLIISEINEDTDPAVLALRLRGKDCGTLGSLLSDPNSHKEASKEATPAIQKHEGSAVDIGDQLNLLAQGSTLLERKVQTIALLKMAPASEHMPDSLKEAGFPPDKMCYVLQLENEDDTVSRIGVHQYKGLAWNKHAVMKLMDKGVVYRRLNPERIGVLVREKFEDIEDCIGIGTTIRFGEDEWVPIYNVSYRSGGFSVTPQGITFHEGTEALLDGAAWKSDGRVWAANEQ